MGNFPDSGCVTQNWGKKQTMLGGCKGVRVVQKVGRDDLAVKHREKNAKKKKKKKKGRGEEAPGG